MSKNSGQVKDFLSIKTRRAGIILYRDIGEDVIFCFGLDSKFHDLTDFSGGVKKGESSVEAAVREFNEETLGIARLTIDDVENSYCIFDTRLFIIFVRVDIDPGKFSRTFNKICSERLVRVDQRHRNCKIEICGIIWVPIHELFRQRDHLPLFEPIQSLLKKHRGFYLNL